MNKIKKEVIKTEKKTEQTIDEKVTILEQTTSYLRGDLNLSDTHISRLKKHIQEVEVRLKFFIDKQTSEIRVLGKDGKWGGYTGVFYVDSKDRKKIITEKALNHYKRYFENNTFYENRTLGLFIRNPKGRKLIKVLQDNDNRIDQGMEK